MLNKPFKCLVLAAILSMATVGQAFAHETEESQVGSKISVSAGFDITTAYFFRGIGQENNGFIIQPWADLGFALYDGDGAINSVSMNVGIWESFHDNQTGAMPSSDADTWYEADYYIGFTVGLLDNWETSLTYTWYASPNDAFSTIEDITWSISFDDSDCWKSVDIPGFEGLGPTFTFIFETENQADGGLDEGIYFAIGIEPSFTIIESVDHPVTFSIPVLLVFDLDDYYESAIDGDTETFAYLDIGFMFSTPLTIIPTDFGQWTVAVGAHVLLLNDPAEDISQVFGTGGDSTEVIGVFSVSMEF